MTLIGVSTNRPTGRSLFAFPDSGNLANYANGLGNRVALVESAAPNLGRYTANLDDSVDTLWRVFEGAAQPASWAASLEYFDLAAGQTANGSGQFAVTIAVRSGSPASPIRGALVTIQDATGAVIAYASTGSSGNVPFLLNAGNFTVSISAAGFVPVVADALTVSANATVTKSITQQPITPPSVAGLCNLVVTAVKNGNAVQNALVTATLQDTNNLVSQSLASNSVESTRTSALGTATLTLIQAGQFTRGGTYRVTVLDPMTNTAIHDRVVRMPNTASAILAQLPDV
jgi:hypothetical protein